MKNTPIILPATLHEMHNSEGWKRFEESKLGNDLFLSDPDRASRMHDAAEDGADGSTHSERIDDQREYVDELYSEAVRQASNIEDEFAALAWEEEIEAWHDRFTAELDTVEKWHADHGTLHEQVG